MSVKMSEMTADSSVAGTEKILVLDGTTSKTMTVDVLSASVIDDLIGAASATPTTGDVLLGCRSTTEKSFTLDGVSSYAVDYVFDDASAAAAGVSGDKVLIDRSGTQYTLTVDLLTTYVLTGVQADVLDISGLSAATLANTDLLPVCQTTTAKKTTIASLETLLWTDFATYTGALSAATAGADADKLYILQSGVPKYLTLTLLSDYVVAEILAANSLTADVLGAFDDYVIALSAEATMASTDLFYVLSGGTAEKKVTLATLTDYLVDQVADLPWTEVNASKYTAAPATTSTLTMSDTSDVVVGYPVRYQIGGTNYYGIVTAVNANALLTIAGAPMSGTLQNLYVGLPERVMQKHFFIDTAFGNAVQDLLSSVTYERFRWEMADAYLVAYAATSGLADTGATEPKINVKVAGNLVGTEDSNNGISLSSTAGTWTASSAVAISTSYYDISRGDAVDIRCTAAGTNGDAECLSVDLTFVLE